MVTRHLLIRLGIALGGLVVASIAALTVLIFATSAPELPPPPLPTATAQPAPHPSALLQVRMSANPAGAEAQTDLAFDDPTRPYVADPPCTKQDRWSLTVNPQDVVGYPYPSSPSTKDWQRAANLIRMAHALCPAAVTLQWLAHNPARPTSDHWMALLPGSLEGQIEGSSLRRYALRHAQQV